jgi:hypothetical protein
MGSPNSGAMLPTPIHTKQIQAMAGEIYRVAIGRTGFRELYIFCGVPVRQAIGYESRGGEFESLWARTSEQKSPRLSVHSMVCAATGPFSKGQTPVQLGLNCGGNVNTSKDTLSALAARLPSFLHMKKVLPGTILESHGT